MKSSRRQATIATLIGGTTNTFIVSLQAVILIPFYLDHIGPKLYGAWLGSGDVLVWMQAFDLGLPNLMIQRIGAAHGQGDRKQVGTYFATGALTLAFIAILVILAAYGISFFLPSWMGLSGEEATTLQSAFVIAAIAAGINIFTNSAVGLSRGIQDTEFLNGAVVVGSVSGFILSFTLVLNNAGLWAIVWGMMLRSSIVFLAGGLFSINFFRHNFSHVRVKKNILIEFSQILPTTALGGISYAVMNQSESALVAIILRPELAVIFTLTRKAIDVARSLVNMISVSTYGSFAHLVSSTRKGKTLLIFTEISAIRLTLAIALAAGYMAVNESLVSLWVGADQYGGTLLTVSIALRFVVVGGAFLINYLYRASGPIKRGSFVLFLESLFRVPLMIGFLLWFGLPGLPLAGIITSTIFGYITYKWLKNEVFTFSEPIQPTAKSAWVVRGLFLFTGILICIYAGVNSWLYVFGMGTFIVTSSLAIMIYTDPHLISLKEMILKYIEQIYRLYKPKN